jgi:hypothetical protein
MFGAVKNDNSTLLTTAAAQLRAQWDPAYDTQDEASRRKMDVKSVFSVFPPDQRGFEEILFVDQYDEAWTALVEGKSRRIVSVEKGW